jgi:hypothetical protein
MYVRIGYSNESASSGLIASQGTKRNPLVRVPPAPFVDAVYVEVVPTAAYRHGIATDLIRAQTGIRLYSTIFNYPQSITPGLCISV